MDFGWIGPRVLIKPVATWGTLRGLLPGVGLAAEGNDSRLRLFHRVECRSRQRNLLRHQRMDRVSAELILHQRRHDNVVRMFLFDV